MVRAGLQHNGECQYFSDAGNVKEATPVEPLKKRARITAPFER